MSKSFAEWKNERRVTITLPSGVEAEIRRPSALKSAEIGTLPGLESGDDTKIASISRRYIETCLVRLGEEKDPIGRGLMEADDLSIEEINAIVDAAIQLMPKKEVEPAGPPLAGTASPTPSPESSTE